MTTMAAGTGRGMRSRAANVALWIVQAVLAFMFVGAGYAKLAGNPDMVAMYEVIGVGQWFRYATGVLEIAGAILLLIPASAAAGALLLACVMAGAVLAHLLVVGGSPLMAMTLLVLALAVAWFRRDRLPGRRAA